MTMVNCVPGLNSCIGVYYIAPSIMIFILLAVMFVLAFLAREVTWWLLIGEIPVFGVLLLWLSTFGGG